ncbi:MAG: alkaline phosphatase family protein [Gemmatimonadetes bacterium]|nr:alkaline phosphatase family protein [Gemmatimonadota bacterium]
MSKPRKVVVLGVDGADFRYYRRWIEKGLTPNFAKLAERGRMGILQSTYPPVTAPAWISMMTGESPGHHGIVGFAAPFTGEITRKVVNASSVESPTVWEIIGQHERDSLVVNVPLTYPVRPMRGILVSGMLTPEGAEFTWPREYLPELRLLQPDYRIDLAWQDYKDRGHDLVRDQKAMTRARAELCVKLLQTKPWDFFFVVFTGTDRLQHCLHEHVMRIDDDRAVRDDSLTAAVRDYFVSLDERLGDLMEAAGEDAHFIVVSDHGFGPLDKNVYFNRWLADEGLLTLKPRGAGASRKMWKTALNRVGITRSTITSLGRAVGLGDSVEREVQKLNPFVGGIEWSRTKVHYYPTNGFFVNLEGRDAFGIVKPGAEYEAVVSDLIARLEAMKDPRTGERLLPVVKRRDELFRGRNVDKLPDVFVEFLDQPYDAFMQDYDVPGVFVKPDWGNGTHRRNGLFIGAGPNLASGDEIEGMEIFDVAPNVLHLLGLPIPEHMDGRFRPDLFTGEAAEGARFEALAADGGSRYGISEEEERDLEEKLRGLGYL